MHSSNFKKIIFTLNEHERPHQVIITSGKHWIFRDEGVSMRNTAESKDATSLVEGKFLLKLNVYLSQKLKKLLYAWYMQQFSRSRVKNLAVQTPPFDGSDLHRNYDFPTRKYGPPRRT